MIALRVEIYSLKCFAVFQMARIEKVLYVSLTEAIRNF